MSDEKSTKRLRKRARKVLYRLLLGVAGLLVLCAALVLALPSLVSSDFVRARLVAELAKATGKPARLDALSLGWSDGLRVKGLAIGSGAIADPEFLVSLESLHAEVGILAALRGDVRLLVELNGLRARVPAKPEPPQKPLAEILQNVFALLRAGLSPAQVKLDAHVKVDLSDMTVFLEPKPGGKALELRNVRVNIDAPGLRSAPLTLAASLDVYADQRLAAPVRFEASMAGLLTPAGQAALGQAVLTANGQAPGVDFSASGSVAKTLKADLRIKLSEALDAARALSPSPLPGASGDLALGLTLFQPVADKLNASVLVSADALHASGIGAQGKSAGPLSFSLRQEAELDLAAQTMRLPGSLDLKPTSQARWLAELTGIAEGKPRVVLSVKPLHLALGELLPAVRGFLPPGVDLGSATLDAASIDATANIPAPRLFPKIEARVSGLALDASGIARRDAKGSLSIGGLGLRVDSASVSLPGSRPEAEPGEEAAGQPGMVEANLSLRVSDLRQSAGSVGGSAKGSAYKAGNGSANRAANGSAQGKGHNTGKTEGQATEKPQPKAQVRAGKNAGSTGAMAVTVREFNLPRLNVRVDGFSQSAAALFGVLGKAQVSLEAQAKDIEAQGKAQIPALSAAMRLRADLPAAKSAALNLEALDLAAPVVRVLMPGKKPVEAPLTLHAAAPDIRLSAGASGAMIPAVQALRLDLDLGAALRLAAQASLTGAAGRDLRTDGRMTLDAGKLLALAAPFAPSQAKASGGLSVDWKLAAALQEQQAKTGAQGTPAAKQLSQLVRELRFVSQAEAVLRLGEQNPGSKGPAGLNLDWPLAAKPGEPTEVLHLRGLSTPRPLRLSTRDGARETTLAGSLAFGPMDSLPGLGKLSKPLRGLLTINAAQQDARSVQLSEVLHLDGYALDQNLSLTADKLDKVLDRDADRLAAVLELVDAQISFSLTADNVATALPTAAAKDKKLAGKGRLEAGAEAKLSGGRSLALAVRLLSPGLDLNLGPDMAISGLTSNVRFARRYSLAPGLRCPGDSEAELTPLSEQVFDLFPATPSAPAAGEALGQLLRGATPGASGGSLGLSRLKLKSGGLPLDIRDVELRLDDSGPVPGLRSFRAGLLGGNVLGSAQIRKSAGRYSLNADLAFTGIDPGRLFPAKGPKDTAAQAETSGRVRLEVPLTPDPEALLQRLSLQADITKIGPRTLERMLYALDPEEQNETIVQQRRLMGIGYPRYLRVAAAYGNLSVSGAVEVKGFQLDLPQVDRLAIANLPIRKQLTKPLAAVPALIKALDAASGSRICRNPADAKGALRIVQPAATQGATR